jgi:hypothetical protein
VEVQDGVILKAEPKEIIGYVAVPFAKWAQDTSYA